MSAELPLDRRVEKFLQELEKPVPFKDRCAHAIANQPELVAVCRELLQVLAGQGEAHMTLAGKATRLCVALQPLFTPSRLEGRHMLDEMVEGVTKGKARIALADTIAELERR